MTDETLVSADLAPLNGLVVDVVSKMDAAHDPKYTHGDFLAFISEINNELEIELYPHEIPKDKTNFGSDVELEDAVRLWLTRAKHEDKADKIVGRLHQDQVRKKETVKHLKNLYQNLQQRVEAIPGLYVDEIHQKSETQFDMVVNLIKQLSTHYTGYEAEHLEDQKPEGVERRIFDKPWVDAGELSDSFSVDDHLREGLPNLLNPGVQKFYQTVLSELESFKNYISKNPVKPRVDRSDEKEEVPDGGKVAYRGSGSGSRIMKRAVAAAAVIGLGTAGFLYHNNPELFHITGNGNSGTSTHTTATTASPTNPSNGGPTGPKNGAGGNDGPDYSKNLLSENPTERTEAFEKFIEKYFDSHKEEESLPIKGGIENAAQTLYEFLKLEYKTPAKKDAAIAAIISEMERAGLKELREGQKASIKYMPGTGLEMYLEAVSPYELLMNGTDTEKDKAWDQTVGEFFRSQPKKWKKHVVKVKGADKLRELIEAYGAKEGYDAPNDKQRKALEENIRTVWSGIDEKARWRPYRPRNYRPRSR